jgi:hypothetical protein
MLQTAPPISDTMATCPAVPIWVLPTAELGFAIGAPGNRLEPIPPSSSVFESIPAADFKKKVGQPEGDPFAILFVPAEVHRERVKVSSFVPQSHIALPAFHAKTGHLCAPIASRMSAVDLAAETGQKDRRGRSLGATLATPQPLATEPHIDSTGWRATPLKPFQPLPSEPFAVVFRAQAGSSAVVRTKTALRELALPSPRPWQTLAILWQSIGGFHFAMPMAEPTTKVGLQDWSWLTPWNSCADADLPGQQFLEESSEVPFVLQPLLEGTRTPISRVAMVEVVTPVGPGLKQPLRGSRSPLESQPFPQAAFSEMFPLPVLAKTPLPAIALPEGLAIWTGIINSYKRHHWRSPRLREGGRNVHTLQLGPSAQVEAPFEMSAT